MLPRSILFSSAFDFCGENSLFVRDCSIIADELAAVAVFSFREIETTAKLIKTPTPMPAIRIPTERFTDQEYSGFEPDAIRRSSGRRPNYNFHTINMIGCYETSSAFFVFCCRSRASLTRTKPSGRSRRNCASVIFILATSTGKAARCWWTL